MIKIAPAIGPFEFSGHTPSDSKSPCSNANGGGQERNGEFEHELYLVP